MITLAMTYAVNNHTNASYTNTDSNNNNEC